MGVRVPNSEREHKILSQKGENVIPHIPFFDLLSKNVILNGQAIVHL